MSQIFSPGTNTFARISLLVGGVLLVAFIILIFSWDRSPYVRAPIGIAVAQPVRFSHELHNGQLNIDCLYCHETVDNAAYGGIPDTHTCMSCHSQIATYSELLEPVRESYATGEPLAWNRVHDLADHVYFNHGIHMNSGVACETCHGPVDQMPLVWRNESMHMQWCLECHWEPERYLRPADEVYTFGYVEPDNQIELGLQLIEDYQIDVDRLDNCNVCHY